LTNNNTQIWPRIQLCATCALLTPLQQRISGPLLWSDLSFWSAAQP